jgi:hypothetical protein
MPGPSNLYGVANPVLTSGVQGPSGDFTCPAGVLTVVLQTGPIIAPSPGYYYPMVWGVVIYGTGATPPSDVYVGLTINGGSFVDNYKADGNYYAIANATFDVNFALVGTPSNTLWRSPGSVIQIAIEPFTQPVSYRGYTPRFVYSLFRAADQ